MSQPIGVQMQLASGLELGSGRGGTVHQVDSASVSPAPRWTLILSCLPQARLWWQWILATTQPRVAVPARRATTGMQTASAASGTRSVHPASELSIPVRQLGYLCVCVAPSIPV